MAVANKQLDVATNNSENLGGSKSPLPKPQEHPCDLDFAADSERPAGLAQGSPADVKTKLYTWVLSYGRIGTPEEIASAKKVMADLQWAPFIPSSNDQLLPIRVLEANKSIMKIKGDAKLSAEKRPLRSRRSRPTSKRSRKRPPRPSRARS